MVSKWFTGSAVITVGLLQAFFDSKALCSNRRCSDHPPLVIEVGQNDAHAIALLSKGVGDRNADLVKGDKCSPSDRGVSRLDLFRLDSGTSRN